MLKIRDIPLLILRPCPLHHLSSINFPSSSHLFPPFPWSGRSGSYPRKNCRLLLCCIMWVPGCLITLYGLYINYNLMHWPVFYWQVTTWYGLLIVMLFFDRRQPLYNVLQARDSVFRQSKTPQRAQLGYSMIQQIKHQWCMYHVIKSGWNTTFTVVINYCYNTDVVYWYNVANVGNIMFVYL